MFRKGLNERERLTRLIGGAMITGIVLSGGMRSTLGKTFIGLLGAAALMEGVVNQHLTDYLRQE